MFNPTKRPPLIITDGSKDRHLVIFEYSVGGIDSYSDLQFPTVDDESLDAARQAVASFVRFALDAIPMEFTHESNIQLMRALRVDAVQVAEQFIERVHMRAHDVSVCRLYVIYQNSNVRIAHQFVQPERDYVADLDLTGMRTQIVTQLPNQDPKAEIREFKFGFQMEVSPEHSTAQRRSEFYVIEGLMALEEFLGHVKTVYNSLGRMLVNDYRKRKLNAGAKISAIQDLKQQKFDFDIIEIKKAYSKAISQLIAQLDIVDISDEDKLGYTVTGASVMVDLRIRIDNHGPEAMQRLAGSGELSTTSIFKIEGGGEDKEFKVLWQRDPVAPPPKKIIAPSQSQAQPVRPVGQQTNTIRPSAPVSKPMVSTSISKDPETIVVEPIPGTETKQ